MHSPPILLCHFLPSDGLATYGKSLYECVARLRHTEDVEQAEQVGEPAIFRVGRRYPAVAHDEMPLVCTFPRFLRHGILCRGHGGGGQHASMRRRRLMYTARVCSNKVQCDRSMVRKESLSVGARASSCGDESRWTGSCALVLLNCAEGLVFSKDLWREEEQRGREGKERRGERRRLAFERAVGERGRLRHASASAFATPARRSACRQSVHRGRLVRCAPREASHACMRVFRHARAHGWQQPSSQ
eukprot:3998483-Pleurochrysis_carterae.AAC.1